MNARDPRDLRQRLRLYWVMDGSDLDSDIGQGRVIDALQSGVGCIQLRDKRSDTQTLIKRTQTLMRLARPWRWLPVPMACTWVKATHRLLRPVQPWANTR